LSVSAGELVDSADVKRRASWSSAATLSQGGSAGSNPVGLLM
jgi:hypothetical protein